VQQRRHAEASGGAAAVQFPSREAVKFRVERPEQRIGDDLFVDGAIRWLVSWFH
jgi:hypothetical protein